SSSAVPLTRSKSNLVPANSHRRIGVNLNNVRRILPCGSSRGIVRRRGPLLAQSRHQLLRCICPLLGAKRTSGFGGLLQPCWASTTNGSSDGGAAGPLYRSVSKSKGPHRVFKTPLKPRCAAVQPPTLTAAGHKQ